MRQLAGLVKITPVGERSGANPSAQFTQIDAALARNDLASALALYDKLPDTIRTDTSGWASAARARAKADVQARAITADALAILAKAKS